MSSGGMPEVAKATVTIIPNMEGSQGKIASDLGAITEPAAKASGKKAGSSFATSMGGAIKAGSAAVVGATAAIGTAAIGAGKAIWDNANAMAEYGDNIDKTSQKIGISAEAFQEWDYVFERSGADINKLQVGMKTMASVITDATAGSDLAVEKLSAVGLAVEDLNGLSQEEQLSLVISKLQEMGSGAERTAAASDLLGKSAVDMAAVLNMSAEDTQALIDEAHDYGMVMSDEGVAASAAFEDSLTKLSNTTRGVGASLMGSLMPSLTGIMDGFSDLISGKSGGAEKVAEGFTSLLSGISDCIPAAIDAFTQVFTAVADQLPAIMQTLVGAIIGALPTIIDGIITILPMLIETVTTLIIMLAQSLPQIIMPIVDAIPTIVPALIAGLITALPAIIEGLMQLMLGIVQAMPTIAQSLIDSMPMLIELLIPALMSSLPQLIAGCVQLTAGLVAALPQIIAALIQAIPTIITSLITAVQASWPTFISSIQTLGTQLLAPVAEIGNSILTTVKTAFTNVVTTAVSIFGTLASKVKAKLTSVITTVTSWGSQLASRGKAAAEKLVSAVVDKVKAIPDQMASIGKNIVEGLWNGINDMTGWITDKIAGFCNSAIQGIKDFFGIESPSKVMRDEVGEMLVRGMAAGIEKNEKIIDSAMTKAGKLVSSSFEMNLALAGDNPSAGLKSNTFTNNITVNGAQDPNAWASQFVKTLNRQARMSMG